MNFLGKYEYFSGNSLNASCVNVKSGSAYVTHTLVFFSQLSLSESIPMSVIALSSDAGGGGLLDFWNGGADMLTWGRRNYLGSKISRYQKCYTCSEIWGSLDYLRSDISIVPQPSKCLKFQAVWGVLTDQMI